MMKAVKIMKPIIKLLPIILIMCSCSAQWHLRKAITKDPSIIDTVKVVTVDTVWLEVKKIDTLFKYKFDTISFVKDSVRIKFHYQYLDSIVYLDVDCPDCPSINKTESKTTVVDKKSGKRFIDGLIAGLILGFVVVLVFVLRRIK